MKLTRQRRMRQWGEFQAVRKLGHSTGGRFIVLGAHQDPAQTSSSFGFITSKKASKKAVIRNLLRRRFREIVRKHGDSILTGHRVVTIARWRAAEATFHELEADWIKTAKRLKIWQEHSTGTP